MEKVLLAAFPDEIAARLEPHRHGRSGHRPDGRGADRHLHHPQAARAVDARPHDPGRADGADRAGAPRLPGQKLSFTQPIEHADQRDDLRRARRRGRQAVRRRLRRAEGQGGRDRAGAAVDSRRAPTSAPSRSPASRCLQVRVNQDEIARYGMPAKRCSTWSSRSAASRWSARSSRASCASRWSCACRSGCGPSPEAIGAMLIADPDRRAAPARRGWPTSQMVEGPSTITREWGQRRITVSATSAAGTWAASWPRPSGRSPQQVQLPHGPLPPRVGRPVREPARARQRLLIVVPRRLALIFGLLYLTYRNVVDALLVFTGVPFACGRRRRSRCGCATCRSRSRRPSASSPCPAWRCSTT